jgi:hypothetical protein
LSSINYGKVSIYRALKVSAFVFETPEQRAAVLKQVQKFEKRTGAGLELLVFRRTYKGRRQGSLTDLAEELYQLIRQGDTNLVKALNLNKLTGPLLHLSEERLDEVDARTRQAQADLLSRIDARNLDRDLLPTAYLVVPAEVAV